MGKVLQFFDGIRNALTGAGTSVDRRTYSTYQFCQLSQPEIETAYRSSWLMRKIVDLPPYDMTRAWRDWQAEADKIEALEAEEKRLGIREKVRTALQLGRLGGGALILGVDQGAPDTPLPAQIRKGALRYVHVMNRWQLALGDIVMDPTDPLFGQPAYFQINGGNGSMARVHPSRVIAFPGASVPCSIIAQHEAFWGDSIVQVVMEAVQNADTATAGIASLIDEAKVDVIGIPGLTANFASAEYEGLLMGRLSSAALGKSLHRALIIDSGNGQPGSGETWEQRQITWNGMPEVIRTFLAVVAGAADIPATRLLGKSPDGMNATGSGDADNYDEMISGRQQNDLRPLLDRLDYVLIPSALGSRPSDIYSEFAPLAQPKPKELADIEKVRADTVAVYVNTGLIPTDALAKATANMMVESGQWPGLEKAIEESEEELGGEPDVDPNEPDPSELAIDPKTGKSVAPKIAANDAAPRTLYVRRDVVNIAEIAAWAKLQGIPDLVDDLHATITYSRAPVDWIKMGEGWDGDGKGQITITPGGPRVVEPLGGMSAVLMFASSSLTYRNLSMRENGAAWDWPDYQPHISLTKSPVDLSSVEPYRGKIVLGPEIFEEVDEGRA